MIGEITNDKNYRGGSSGGMIIPEFKINSIIMRVVLIHKSSGNYTGKAFNITADYQSCWMRVFDLKVWNKNSDGEDCQYYKDFAGLHDLYKQNKNDAEHVDKILHSIFNKALNFAINHTEDATAFISNMMKSSYDNGHREGVTSIQNKFKNLLDL